MPIIIPEDQYSIMLNMETGIKHLKYEDPDRHNWDRTVCGNGISESKVLTAAPKIKPRAADCKRCLSSACDQEDSVFVGPEEYDHWTEYGKKSRKSLKERLEEGYRKATDESGGFYEKIEFLNGSYIEITAHSPAMGDCGDAHIFMTIGSVSYGKTQRIGIDFNAHSFNRVSDAMIYLMSKVKTDIAMYSTGEFYDPHKDTSGILNHIEDD
jgi:hypothetical protein